MQLDLNVVLDFEVRVLSHYRFRALSIKNEYSYIRVVARTEGLSQDYLFEVVFPSSQFYKEAFRKFDGQTTVIMIKDVEVENVEKIDSYGKPVPFNQGERENAMNSYGNIGIRIDVRGMLVG